MNWFGKIIFGVGVLVAFYNIYIFMPRLLSDLAVGVSLENQLAHTARFLKLSASSIGAMSAGLFFLTMLKLAKLSRE